MDQNYTISNKVRVFLLNNGKLAVTYAKSSKTFILPGGKIEKNESTLKALYREVLEETRNKINCL